MNNDEIEQQQAILAAAIKTLKDNFSPVLSRELYTQLAKEYKISYDCYRKEGFSMIEALRLTVKYYD